MALSLSLSLSLSIRLVPITALYALPAKVAYMHAGAPTLLPPQFPLLYEFGS